MTGEFRPVRKARRLGFAALLALAATPVSLSAQGTLPEWGRAVTPAEGRELRAEIGRLSRRLGVRETTLVAIARILGADRRNPGFADLIERVRSQAGRAVELRSQIEQLRAQVAALTDAAVRSPAASALASAAAAFNEGRLDAADQALAELENLRGAESEAAHAAWADAVEARARIAELRLDYDRADALRLAAVREEERRVRLSIERQWRFHFRRALARYQQGEILGDNAALDLSIAIFRNDALRLAPRGERPMDWAAAQVGLGNALSRLGERESGTARLEQAVTAFEAALQEYTREGKPLEWAVAQNNLGLALSTLGQRESGTARLERAVTALEAALGERTRERVPLEWAATQTNLGLALLMLAEREIGTARLERAVTALEAALEEQRREQVPLAWAATQHNLGSAFLMLGQREGGAARLERAVTALEAALQEYTRERVPLKWAAAHNELGIALAMLGELDSGTTRLERAVTALEAALEEQTRARVPLLWAATQNNLGNTLRILGERESGTARLEQAVRAYESALEEYVRTRVPLQWATTITSRGYVIALIVGRTGDAARLDEAEGQVREARDMLAAGGHAPGLAMANYVLGLIASLRARPGG